MMSAVRCKLLQIASVYTSSVLHAPCQMKPILGRISLVDHVSSDSSQDQHEHETESGAADTSDKQHYLMLASVDDARDSLEAGDTAGECLVSELGQDTKMPPAALITLERNKPR